MSSASRNRSVLLIALALLLVGLVAAFANGWFSRPDHTTGNSNQIPKATLRLAWIPQGTFAGDYMALKNGSWKRAGVDVEVRPGGFQFDAIKLVAAGEDTFGISTGPQVAEARSRGVPVVVIGVIFPDSPVGWVAMSKSGIKTPQDFVGKRVGAQFGTLTEVTLETLFKKMNLPLGGIRRVPMQFDYTPFLSGAIDVAPVYMIDQPVEFRRKGFSINVIDPRQYGVNLGPGNVYITSEETLRLKPKVVEAFLAGGREGWIAAEKDHRSAAEAVLPHTAGGDVESLTAQVSAVFKFIGHTDSYPGIFAK
jgi:NitT/TauT family transport system substrate-binding protein